MKRAAAICLLFALLLSFAACAPTERVARGFSMGSDYGVTYLFDGDLDREIAGLFVLVEGNYSLRVDNSVIARINAADVDAPITLSAEECEVLTRIFDLSERTNGAFDPAIYPLVKLWGFDPPYEMNGEVPPSAESVTQVKDYSSVDSFSLSSDLACVVKKSSDASLDLGAAMKGYAVDVVSRFLSEKGVAEALVDLGGTIGAVGRSYEIGVTPPRDSRESFAFRFTLAPGKVCATSGDYERFYVYNGKRYHHILDAKTGYPADSGVISATVVSESGLLADALATAVVVLGAEKGAALLREFGAQGAIVTADKRVVTVDLPVTIKDESYVLA